MDVKNNIEQALMPLIGLPLSDMWRFAGYQCFEIGPQMPSINRKGNPTTVADYALHVASEWHAYHNQIAVLGSDSYGPRLERHEEAAHPFFRLVEAATLIIESLSATEEGNFTLRFQEDYQLEILARNSFATAEYWRFLLPQQRHWVFTSQGLKVWRDDILGMRNGTSELATEG